MNMYSAVKENLNQIDYYTEKINTYTKKVTQIDNLNIIELNKLYKILPDAKNKYNNQINVFNKEINNNIQSIEHFNDKIKEFIFTDNIITYNEELEEICDFVNEILKDVQNIKYFNETEFKTYLNILKHKIKIYFQYIETIIFSENVDNCECIICYEKTNNIIRPTCNHFICEVCFYKTIDSFYNNRHLLKDKNNLPKCPICRNKY